MSKAFVLMTALPPTYGHLDLIQFAGELDVDRVVVLLNTQPDEPMSRERFLALASAAHKLDTPTEVRWQNEEVQQEATGPDDQAFWDDWVKNLKRFGFKEGDTIVASEAYGVRLAKEAGGRFMVYDRDRWVRYTKGTRAREDYIGTWDTILPEFRQHLQKTVTMFGAESVGKTTLTRALAKEYAALDIPTTTLFEWARPYLEMTGPEVTHQGMMDIWEGQRALQTSSYEKALSPLIIQDTDLFTTLGFWEDWDPESVPRGLLADAESTQSDLYVILRSNIPFEHDILRYGGDERQTSDQYWIDFCIKYGLNYVVLDESSLADRVGEAMDAISPLLTNPITYQRVGSEYERH
ncbi:adenylyltransferase [Microbacterium phage Cece]|nr:adenylyltransferase [Microbacterium phage Cece]